MFQVPAAARGRPGQPGEAAYDPPVRAGGMRFSSLLSQLPSLPPDGPRDLADDPELRGAESLERAASGQLSFLEAGNALAGALASCGASALLIPADSALQQQASARNIAWVACSDPRLKIGRAHV